MDVMVKRKIRAATGILTSAIWHVDAHLAKTWLLPRKRKEISSPNSELRCTLVTHTNKSVDTLFKNSVDLNIYI